MSKLKVYSTHSLDGRNEAICATTSQKEFTRLSGVGRDYIGSPLDPDQDGYELAMANPGTVFKRPSLSRDGTPWEPMSN